MIRRLAVAIILLTIVVIAIVGSRPSTAAAPLAGGDSVRRVLTPTDSLKALEALASQINDIVKLPEAKSGKVGIEIRSLTTNKVLYSLNADKPLTPASTTKIVTTFTALSELGPNYVVRTIAAGDYKPGRDGTLKGNLYVKGYGDPFLSINDVDVLVDQIVNSGIKVIEGDIVGDGSFFDEKIERTQYSGDEDVVVPLPPIYALTLERSVFTVIISSPRIPGEPLNVQTYPTSAGFEIVNNAVTASPPQRRPPARKKGNSRGKRRGDAMLPFRNPHSIDDGSERYGDESPLNYEDLSTGEDPSTSQRRPKKSPTTTSSKRSSKSPARTQRSATTKPPQRRQQAAKSPAKAPATSVKKVEEEKVAAVPAEKRGPIRVSISSGENGRQIVTVNGTLSPNKTVSYRYQMRNPPVVVAGMVYHRLKSHGIAVNGRLVSGVTPARHRVIAETGRPLNEILHYVMKNSNNFLAEYVFKIIGGAAGGQQETAEKTVEKIEYRMNVNRVPFGTCIINDGSGLSRANCLSATALAAILNAAHGDKKIFESFYQTMSIAGVDGTLRKRMKGTFAEGNVHGKTGTLRNVSALAGYVTTRDGEVLCFSMLMNGGNHGAYRAVQDKVAAKLAGFSYNSVLMAPPPPAKPASPATKQGTKSTVAK